MNVYCQSCKKKSEKVKTLKGRAKCCGSWNSLVRLPKERKGKNRG